MPPRLIGLCVNANSLQLTTTASRVRMHWLADSVARSRVLQRGGRRRYFECRKNAMSHIASYRTKWIRMLQPVSDNYADNPVAECGREYHLYQFTYFVELAHYCLWRRHMGCCMPMNTGDPGQSLPFAPHSFTARSDSEPAHILSPPYREYLLGDTHRELAILVDRVGLCLKSRGHEQRIRPHAGHTCSLRSEPEQTGRYAFCAPHPVTIVGAMLSHPICACMAVAQTLSRRGHHKISARARNEAPITRHSPAMGARTDRRIS